MTSRRGKVLVTGGAGYVGSHVCLALAEAGFEPVALDNLRNGHAWAVQWGPLAVGDVTDPVFLAAQFAQHQPVAVMHFAALIEVAESVADPLRFYRNNVVGTLCLLEAMAAASCPLLVFSSTCAIFGQPPRVPLDEDLPIAPINPYGQAKAMAETMILDWQRVSGGRAARLRYFNVAGADPLSRIGEAHDPESHLIPLALMAASGLGGQGPLTVNGSDYPTPDGTAVRDYIHVTDLAAAHVLALEALVTGGPALALNLGNGAGHSVRQVLDCVEQVTGSAVPHRFGPRRVGDPPILVADSRRAREQLGWMPERGSLETQIGDAWAWMQAYAARGNRDAQP
ncbi:MAG: UDP-glucose 4-epimerase GalE [Rhodospirillaceae bacterium]